MPIIDTKNYPKGVAVLYATNSQIRRVARDAAWLIQQPEFNAIVILRPNNTLFQSFQIASKSPEIKSYPNVKILAPDISVASLIRKIQNDDSDITNLTNIQNLYGLDFRIFGEFCEEIGPSTFAVRSIDQSNRYSHVDTDDTMRSYFELYSQLPRSSQDYLQNLLPHSVTATIAVKGQSTYLIDDENNLIFLGSKWTIFPDKKTLPEEKIWHAPTGSITLIRSNGWGKTHKPSLHNAPLRLSDGNENERIAGVAYIFGH